MSATASRGAADTVPIANEMSERVVRTLVFAVPPASLALAGWLAWGGLLHWQDLLVLAITYVLTGLGITVGYHRLFTHRSFKTTRLLRALLAVLGSMAVEGPVIEWVATSVGSTRAGSGRKPLVATRRWSSDSSFSAPRAGRRARARSFPLHLLKETEVEERDARHQQDATHFDPPRKSAQSAGARITRTAGITWLAFPYGVGTGAEEPADGS